MNFYDPKRVTTVLKFLIKWLGYDDTHNTWELWKEVRDVETLHTYLRANNLQKIIPKKFSEYIIASWYQDHCHCSTIPVYDT
jgi:hypothetical protein